MVSPEILEVAELHMAVILTEGLNFSVKSAQEASDKLDSQTPGDRFSNKFLGRKNRLESWLRRSSEKADKQATQLDALPLLRRVPLTVGGEQCEGLFGELVLSRNMNVTTFQEIEDYERELDPNLDTSAFWSVEIQALREELSSIGNT